MSEELITRINNTFQELALDIKKSVANDGDLTSLKTSTQVSLVAAINALHDIATASTGALIAADNLSDVADVATARTNLDVNSKTEAATAITTAISGVTLTGLGGTTPAEVNAAIAAVVGAAPEALNTLQEIAEEMANDDTAFAALTLAVSNKVSYSAAQVLDDAQKLTACTNIGIGNPDFDFKSAYITTRDAAA